MEDRETARVRKYGESKTTRIVMATVSQVTSGLGLRKFQARWIFVDTSVLDVGSQLKSKAAQFLRHFQVQRHIAHFVACS